MVKSVIVLERCIICSPLPFSISLGCNVSVCLLEAIVHYLNGLQPCTPGDGILSPSDSKAFQVGGRVPGRGLAGGWRMTGSAFASYRGAGRCIEVGSAG